VVGTAEIERGPLAESSNMAELLEATTLGVSISTVAGSPDWPGVRYFVIGVSIASVPVNALKIVTFGLPTLPGIVMPEGSVVVPSIAGIIELSLVASMTGVSTTTVPGSPFTVAGMYLVMGSVIEPVPEYGLIMVVLGLWGVGGRVITGLSVIGPELSEA
jgi:hypothetical protein